MKKFTLYSTLLILTSLLSFTVNAQVKPDLPAQVGFQRCATTEWYEEHFQANPAFRAQFEANQARISQLASQGSSNRTSALIDTIPVVVHIIMANASTVTDATVQSQIDILNEDFKGLNADSSLIPAAFKPLFGKSGIHWMLARQDPSGDPTNSINRRNNAITFTSGTSENAKTFATGGLDAWDPCRYLNIWVVQFTDGLLGISVFPGTVGRIPGFVNEYRAFGRGPSYLYPQFNKGRTATHELGHFVNLRHINGDANCGNDFPGSPAGLDDTPQQSNLTGGCPTGVQTSGCAASPNPPGRMFQNYMDYTDDGCMVMFTKGQISRMETALLFAPDRNCLLSSNTYQAPILFPNDAMIKNILNPATGVTICDNSVVPSVTLKNRGTNALTSVNINLQLDNGTVVTTPWTGNLASTQEVVVNLANLALSAAPHTLKIYTTLPNGVADQQPANDTAKSSFSVGVGLALPLTENFESLTFPPNGWKVINPNAGSITWARFAGALGLPGNTASARINLYNYTTRNHVDILHSPIVSVAGADSAFIEFDNSYKPYGAAAADQDTLEVVVSTDCGQTFQSVWKRGGAQLATALPPITASWVPAAATDWLRRKIDLTAFISANNIIVGFRSINRYGNNIYLDNVNITKVILPNRDLRPLAFTEPFNTICDGANVRPAVQILNQAKDTIRSFTVTYTINNGAPANLNFTGTLPKGQVTTVQLNTQTFTPGTYNIKAWTSNPNGQPDQVPANDTIQFSFTVVPTTDAPLVEGFESSTFPPTNWQITQQPVDAITWQRTTLAARTGVASAYMDNYDYPANGRVDNLISPVVKYAGADSVFLRFDVAAATYSFPGSTAIPLDTLEVLVTRDCGKTFTSIYKKFGNELQTIDDPNNTYTGEFFPTSSRQWRRDSINLTKLLGSSNTIRFVFKNTTNYENNIFIDNVNFTPKVLSARLKQNGFLITPNPFRNRFYIQHFLPPTELRGYGVYNAIGQQVLSRSFGQGMADSYMEVNMDNMPAGMYTIKLMYSGKTVSQKIIKTK